MTTINSSSINLTSLMKDISEALQLDRSEKNEEAYRKYLECVLRITTKLLRNLHSDGGHVNATTDIKKMVKLGQQCMDRVAIIINELYDNSFDKKPLLTEMRLPLSSGPPRTPSTGTPCTPSPREITPYQSMQVTSPSSAVPPVTTQPGVKHTSVAENAGKRRKKLTPMEVALWQNEQILSAFKARQDGAKRGKNKSASVNLSLTLQRKMAENLAIAKAQQEILAKKMKERQQRLEEQAARRFHTPMGLSEEEQHQRLIYRKVLEFEQEELWMIDQRKRLEENPTDVDVICQLITAILGCETHPLTELLKSYQVKMVKKVYHLVEGKTERIEKITVPLPDEMQSSFKAQFKTNETRSEGSKCSIDQSEISLDTPIPSGEAPNSCSDQSESRLQNMTEKDQRDSLSKESNVINSESESCDIQDDVKHNSEPNVTTERQELSIFESDQDLKYDQKMEEICETGNKNDAIIDDSLDKVNENIKTDIQDAIKSGEKLKIKLESENQHLKTLVKQVTEDYDKYNQENMDDLFDDDDDDDTEEDNSDVSYNINKDNAAGDGYIKEENKHSVDTELSKPSKSKTDLEEKSEIFKKNPSFENLENKISELRNEAYHRHLKGITEDILTSIERVQVLFVIAFAELDSAEGRDQCNVLLERFFFTSLWDYLLVLFRLANEPKEMAIASVMTRNQTCSPSDYFVRDELSLAPSSDSDVYPYQLAITELHGIVNCPTTLEKLECLVRTSKQVMQCVEQHYRQTDTKTPAIGADDLLPVLCYIVARSGLPQIVSECHAMDVFIHEGYMFGEEGYCLTSFQTAINYLISQGMPSQSPATDRQMPSQSPATD